MLRTNVLPSVFVSRTSHDLGEAFLYTEVLFLVQVANFMNPAKAPRLARLGSASTRRVAYRDMPCPMSCQGSAWKEQSSLQLPATRFVSCRARAESAVTPSVSRQARCTRKPRSGLVVGRFKLKQWRKPSEDLGD